VSRQAPTPGLRSRPVVGAGWYADPVVDGNERWWDGSTWSEHVRPYASPAPAPAAAPAGLPTVRLSWKALDIAGDARAISFRGTTYPLAEVDRVAYKATRHSINGAYMGTMFQFRLSRPGASGQFALDGGSRDTNIDAFRACWNGCVDLVEAVVCPRLAAQDIARVAAGGTVTYGGIVVGAEGVRAKRPLAKVIPWQEVTGTETNAVGALRVLTRRDGKGDKAKLWAGVDTWNTVLLPRLVRHFTGA